MSHYTKVGGIWKKTNAIYTRQGGVWKEITKGYVKQAGVWKLFHDTSVLLPSAVMTDAQAVNSGNGSTTSHTFSGVNIGTADASRYIVVFAYHPSNSDGMSATIGGVSASKLLTPTTAYAWYGQAFGRAVAAGTTSTIVIRNTTTTGSNFGIIVFALYNLQSTTPFDKTSYGSNSGTIGVAKPCNTNVQDGGLILGFIGGGGTTNRTFAWTGLTADGQTTNASAANLNVGGAHAEDLAAASPLAITGKSSGGTSNTFTLHTLSFR